MAVYLVTMKKVQTKTVAIQCDYDFEACKIAEELYEKNQIVFDDVDDDTKISYVVEDV